MPALGSNANVENTCLRILREWGFVLRLEGPDEGDLTEQFWVAERDGYDLWAGNPIELLGLAAIYRHVQPSGPPEPYWWVVPGPDVRDEVVSAKWPDSEEDP